LVGHIVSRRACKPGAGRMRPAGSPRMANTGLQQCRDSIASQGSPAALRFAILASRKPGVAISLRNPCFAQARGVHPCTPVRHMCRTHGHPSNACVRPRDGLLLSLRPRLSGRRWLSPRRSTRTTVRVSRHSVPPPFGAAHLGVRRLCKGGVTAVRNQHIRSGAQRDRTAIRPARLPEIGGTTKMALVTKMELCSSIP
jgi:hypothetical protein